MIHHPKSMAKMKMIERSMPKVARKRNDGNNWSDFLKHGRKVFNDWLAKRGRKKVANVKTTVAGVRG